MYNIYIDVNKREIVIKDKKDRILKKYTNISTKNTDGMLRAIKLVIFSLNKVFKMNVKYNDYGYIFYINNEDLISYTKTKYERFNLKVHHYWSLDEKTMSELGNFFVIFNRLHNKDIVNWERDELFELKDKKEELYLLQSECDCKVQDVLHEMQDKKDCELTDEVCREIVFKIRRIRRGRNKIKNQIRSVEKKERALVYEKRKQK